MSRASILKGRTRTEVAGGAVNRYRLLKLASDGDVVQAGYGDLALFASTDDADSGNQVPCTMLDDMQGTLYVEVAGAVEKGDYLWPTANGKAIPIGPGCPRLLSLDNASGDGSVVEALPVSDWIGDVHGLFEDFHRLSFSSSDDTATWLKSQTDTDGDGSSVCTLADDEPGGVLKLTTNDNASDAENLQVLGESFQLSSGKKLWVTTRFKVADASECNIAVGIAIEDTDIAGGVSDALLFRTDSGDGDLDYVIEKDSSETAGDTGTDLADGTYVNGGIYFNGADIYVYVGGSEVVKKDSDTNLPDDEALTPSIEVSNASAQANSIYCDYLNVVQQR